MPDTTPDRFCTQMLPLIRVRVGQDPAQPHRGTLSIGDWSVPCAIGRGGLVAAHAKREGDGATPIGRFALRYGFYDPTVWPAATFETLAYPFKPKPAHYDWSEDGFSPLYNRMTHNADPDHPDRRGEAIFDLIVPIGWNDATVAPFAGSAIFLHIARPDFTPTAGCVVVAHDDALTLARRLQPGMMIDIAPAVGTPLQKPPVLTAALEAIGFHGPAAGPRVLVTGAVHGNEPAGPRAIARLVAECRAGALAVQRGSVTFVPVVNGLAWRMARREGDRNLNRDLRERPDPADNEDRVGNVLCRLLRDHDVLIDLHSFGAEGDAMVLLGPEDNTGPDEPFAHAREEAALALALGLPTLVHGWVAAHARARSARASAGLAAVPPASAAIGTTEFIRASGGYGVTVECGRHGAPDAPQEGYQAVLRGLVHLGVLADPGLPAAPPLRLALEIHTPILALHPGDRLLRRFRAAEPVRQGQIIGHRHTGAPITAPDDGALIFASETADPGTELCFACRKSRRFG